jgi:hypothetical protein
MATLLIIIVLYTLTTIDQWNNHNTIFKHNDLFLDLGGKQFCGTTLVKYLLVWYITHHLYIYNTLYSSYTSC